MSDNYEDREVRTTTTGGPATEAPVHTTTTTTARATRGGGSSALWMVLGILAVLAIVALVFMSMRNNDGATPDGTDVNVNLPEVSAPAGDASQAVENAAEDATN